MADGLPNSILDAAERYAQACVAVVRIRERGLSLAALRAAIARRKMRRAQLLHVLSERTHG